LTTTLTTTGTNLLNNKEEITDEHTDVAIVGVTPIALFAG